ncbi:hypothetical protein M885DRAFT_567023 [Pelagophyceae sp. CCMP2097]|nr:hypothetical protein M885DRAFT_567023 [Pelagophyceae sp. CCMP2097]
MEFAPGPAMRTRTARYGCAAVRVDVTNEQPRVVVIGGVGLMTHDNDSDEDESEEDEEEVRVDVTNEQPRVVVIGGVGLTTHDNDSDEDESEEDEEEDEDTDEDEATIYVSSTEVLAVEQNRGAARCRQ